MIRFLFGFLVVLAISTDAFSQANNSANLALDGPNTPAFTEYKLPAGIDPDVLKTKKTELWAVVWYPENISTFSTPRPVLVFLHGNHSTCASATNPNDESCEYTDSGTCDGGMIPTPNHRGYDYVAKNLASWGYVVVSVNANLGITCGYGGNNNADWGLNLARGRLVLKHLEKLMEWSNNGGFVSTIDPAVPAVDANLFKGKLDFSQVGMMGHSRGGEGVRAALAQVTDEARFPVAASWKQRLPGLGIRGIFEIGAVDGQAGVVLDAPGVAWNQILPMCDGDVSSLEGRMPFERMAQNRTYSEPTSSQKSLEYVWGANHNFFNTEWKNDDSWGCVRHNRVATDANGRGSEIQRKVGLVSMAGFFRANVGATTTSDLKWNWIFNTLLNPATYLNALTRIDRVFSTGFTDTDIAVLDDMTSMDPSKTSLGFPRESAGITVALNATQSPQSSSFVWTNSATAPQIEIFAAAVGSGLNVQAYKTLDFRVESGQAAGTLPLSVRLKDTAGSFSNTLKISDLSAYPLVSTPHADAKTFATVRADLTKFSGVDFTNIQSVQFLFDAGTEGKASFAQVRFSKSLGRGLDPIDVVNSNPIADLGNVTEAAPIANVSRLTPTDVRVKSTNQASDGTYLITISSPGGFPVRNAAPQLVVGDKVFSKALYADSKNLKELTFEVKPSELPKKLKKASKKSLASGNIYQDLGITLKYDGAVGETIVQPK